MVRHGRLQCVSSSGGNQSVRVCLGYEKSAILACTLSKLQKHHSSSCPGWPDPQGVPSRSFAMRINHVSRFIPASLRIQIRILIASVHLFCILPGLVLTYAESIPMICAPFRPLTCAQLPPVSRSAVLRSAVALPVISRSKPLMAASAKEPAYEAWVSCMRDAQPSIGCNILEPILGAVST